MLFASRPDFPSGLRVSPGVQLISSMQRCVTADLMLPGGCAGPAHKRGGRREAADGGAARGALLRG